jgi:hypothetical protein
MGEGTQSETDMGQTWDRTGDINGTQPEKLMGEGTQSETDMGQTWDRTGDINWT